MYTHACIFILYLPVSVVPALALGQGGRQKGQVQAKRGGHSALKYMSFVSCITDLHTCSYMYGHRSFHHSYMYSHSYNVLWMSDRSLDTNYSM